MNKYFKKSLLPYLFDCGILVTYMLQNLPNWPKVDVSPLFTNKEDGFVEPLNTDNCEFVDYTDDTLIISCGSEYHGNFILVVGYYEENGFMKMGVIDAYEQEMVAGIDYHMFEALFLDLMEFIPKHIKTANEIKSELTNALSDENYELAAKLRDELLILEK